jgi:hypothetical protein
VLLAGLAPAAVEVGVDLGHGGGVVDFGVWLVGFVVVAGSFFQEDFARKSRKLEFQFGRTWVWTAVSPNGDALAEAAARDEARDEAASARGSVVRESKAMVDSSARHE